MTENERRNTLAPEYFETVYEASEDPWNFTTSEYEAAKYAATAAALPGENYESAFEIGCSIGVLTAQLAEKCERLLAVDVSEKALEQARRRCANLPNVELKLMQFPFDAPAGKFDLIVVSEVGYYLSVEDWQKASGKIFDLLKPKGNVILVHWTHFVEDYPQTGDAVHEFFAAFAAGKLKHLTAERAADYRLDVWEKL